VAVRLLVAAGCRYTTRRLEILRPFDAKESDSSYRFNDKMGKNKKKNRANKHLLEEITTTQTMKSSSNLKKPAMKTKRK
jgi:hypothetical protein